MKEKATLAVILTVSMIAIMILPAGAWEYYDTTIANPKTDNNTELFGPRADKLQIVMYSNELAEFTALELGQIDVTDWPVDAAHYGPWTTPGMNGPGYQDRIAVVDTGPEFGMYILDLRMDNRTLLDDGSANPALNGKNGNPMASLALRRAIASIADRYYAVNTIISGGTPPPLASALYTPLSAAYGSWCHPEINPTGALAQWCYVLANESANVAGGLAWLTAAGYTYDAGADATKDPTGYQFTIDFYYRIDHTYRSRMATEIIQYYLERAPPNGLGMKGNLVMHGVTSAGARQEVMAEKKGHMYTGGWGLTIDPDHLYYLFARDGYWHPGRPPNYMFYPGDEDKYAVLVDGWHYTGFPEVYGWATSGLDFSDPDKTYDAGDEVWMNPNNYWSWEMMIATTDDRAHHCALKSQEFIAWYVCGVPFWASKSYTAFHRTYSGAEVPYSGHPWKGVVDTAGTGVWGVTSFYNMHTDNANWGDGVTPMKIRQGFRQPTMSLNPLYAEWVWDWYVMNNVYDGMIGAHAYTLADTQNLADSWELGTWDSADYGTCTKVTFHMRHDLFWSDGMPLTSSDVKFTWGGPLVTGSISNLLEKKGYPPTYWSSNIADMISVATPDPWTVICYLDVYGYFGLHSMSGFNIVLPEHIWNPIINTGNPTLPWDQPTVCSSSYVMDHTWDPSLHGGVITLSKNTRTYSQNPYGTQTGSRPRPIRISINGTSDGREVYGDTNYIYPKSGDNNVNVSLSVNLYNSWAYETGATMDAVYGDNKTMLDGTKTVTLDLWDGTGTTCDPSKYVTQLTLAENEPWAAERGTAHREDFTVTFLPCWWYRLNVAINITSLGIWNSTAQQFDEVDPAKNSFFNMTYDYQEYFIVTSRYDIGGASMKPYSAPKYQSVADLKVDVKDLYACGKAYGTQPGYPNWNIACDVNNDFKVDVKDYYKIAQNYGWAALNPIPLNAYWLLTYYTLKIKFWPTSCPPGHFPNNAGAIDFYPPGTAAHPTRTECDTTVCYLAGTQVHLTALTRPPLPIQYGQHWAFDHWALDNVVVGPAGGLPNPLTVTMNSNHEVQANYYPTSPTSNQYATLHITFWPAGSPNPGGTVNFKPPNAPAGQTTAYDIYVAYWKWYGPPPQVSLTASQGAPWVFDHWVLEGGGVPPGGGLPNPLLVTMSADHDVQANFHP